MSRQLRCPNCGGEHTLVNPGITMLVCDFCRTVVYWGEDEVLKTGVQSILPEADTRLFMHAGGTLLGTGFEVVGHLKYDHGRGTWDEWYLQLGDGREAWISEDERELSLEQTTTADAPLPGPDQLRVGLSFALQGVTYTVREVGTATCVGGEGQLPFTLLPGERYPYADLASPDGTAFGTLEYDEESPTCFTGRTLSHEELVLSDERPPSTAGAREGKHIRCPSCHAPLELDARREVETLVCAYCGAQNDLTGAEARVMGKNPGGLEPGFYLEIGQGGDLRGRRHEVCGRMLYEDEEGYQSREYLLHNPEAGYLWLAEEANHYVLSRPTQQAPARDPFGMAPKQPVRVGQTEYRFFEQGISRLVYVDGALPWLARVGDRNQYADLVAPPEMFGVEKGGREVEYFRGEYLRPEEVWAAFGLQGSPPRPWGVHPAQPFVRGPAARALIVVGALFGLLNLGLLLWSLPSGGRVIHTESFESGAYLEEAVSLPFVVGPEKILTLRMNAQLENSWLALSVALVDEKERVVQELEGEISYYWGYEEGERWTEGNRSEDTHFKSPPPGTYRLTLKASGGSSLNGPPGRELLTIRLIQGEVLSRYFLAVAVLGLLFPLFALARQLLFEKQRWAPVTEDDDDDNGGGWDD